jgi:hypothetical protein
MDHHATTFTEVSESHESTTSLQKSAYHLRLERFYNGPSPRKLRRCRTSLRVRSRGRRFESSKRLAICHQGKRIGPLPAGIRPARPGARWMGAPGGQVPPESRGVVQSGATVYPTVVIRPTPFASATATARNVAAIASSASLRCEPAAVGRSMRRSVEHSTDVQ